MTTVGCAVRGQIGAGEGLNSLTLSRPLTELFELFTAQTSCAPSSTTEAGLLIPPRPDAVGHPEAGA